MTREELLNERKRFVDAITRINKEIADLDNKINKGKKEKICRLLRELYNTGDVETVKIVDHCGDYLELDLADLAKILEYNFKL